jgi:hypothetical protein
VTEVVELVVIGFGRLAVTVLGERGEVGSARLDPVSAMGCAAGVGVEVAAGPEADSIGALGDGTAGAAVLPTLDSRALP